MNISGSGGTSYRISYSGDNGRKTEKKGRKTVKSGRITVHFGFNSAGVMARIAQARTKTQAAAIGRSLRAQLDNAKGYDCDEVILRAIRKSISRADGKVKALGREERMENSRRAALGADNLKEAQRIAEQLAKKRRARKRRERADIENAKCEDALRQQSRSGRPSWEYEGEADRRADIQEPAFDVSSEGIALSPESAAASVPSEGASVDIVL